MEDFKNRLLEYIRVRFGKGQNKFEDFCGINHGTINSIKVKGPSAEIVAKISSACPDLDLNWLFTGKGAMLKTDSAFHQELKTLPILSFSAVAGSLSDNNGSDFPEPLEEIYVPDFAARGADYGIRVDGDSMYPKYHSGEILAIRVIKDPSFFQWGMVYVLSTNQGCVIKRLFPDPLDPDTVICHSDNSDNYPDYKLKKSDILGIAIVVGHIGV
jgi:SOS-response transcriptional repressor LexA